MRNPLTQSRGPGLPEQIVQAVVGWRGNLAEARSLRMQALVTMDGPKRRQLRDQAREATREARQARRAVAQLGDRYAKGGR